MQYCVLTEAAVRLPQWSISDTGRYIQYWHNFRAKKEHNFQKIDQIFYEYAHLNIMSILLQNIKKNRTHKVTNYYLKNN